MKQQELPISLLKNKEQFLQEAMENGIIRIAFQPIYKNSFYNKANNGTEEQDVLNNKFDKAEVLCRLEYNEKIIMPMDFIPYAENNNLIDYVTEKVIEELSRCFIIYPCFKDVEFSINISPIQLKMEKFAEKFYNMVVKKSLSVKNFILEITESHDYDYKGIEGTNLCLLREYGFRIAIDDFGKGSSNIEKIITLPVDYIKIDKLYIDRIMENSVEKLLKAVIGFGEKLGKYCIAEGIENECQKQILQDLNCPYFQGYYFSKPLWEKEFIDKIFSFSKKGQDLII